MDKITIKEAIVTIKEVPMEVTLVLGDGKKITHQSKLPVEVEVDVLSEGKGVLAEKVLKSILSCVEESKKILK